MGRSDTYVFNNYMQVLSNAKFKTKPESIGFFGYVGENNFTSNINVEKRYFYDLQLKNWNINIFPYNIKEKFDIIICTRCAYFCKEPIKMMKEFYNMLKSDGYILIDWGLGDHWRFDNYKVGWVKDNEHEWAYEKDNFLWSTVWFRNFIKSKEVNNFLRNIKKFGYDYDEHSLGDLIKKEVPEIIYFSDLYDLNFKDIKFSIYDLWEDKPQLNITVLAKK